MSTVNLKDTKPIVPKDEKKDDEKNKVKPFEIKGIDKVLHGNLNLISNN